MKFNRNVKVDPTKDYYNILDIQLNGRDPSKITKKEIEASVRSLRQLHHPDKHPDLTPEQFAGKNKRIIEIEEAKDVLLGKKEEYDKRRAIYKANSGAKDNNAAHGEGKEAGGSKENPKAGTHTDSDEAGRKHGASSAKGASHAPKTGTGTIGRYARAAAGAVSGAFSDIAGSVAKNGVVGTIGRIGGFALRGLTPGGWVATGVMAGAGIVYDMYTGSEAEAKPSPDSKSNQPIANPPKEHKVEPVPEQPEHKALREKKQFEAEKEKFEAEKAEFEAQKSGGHVKKSGGGEKYPGDIKGSVKNEGGVEAGAKPGSPPGYPVSDIPKQREIKPVPEQPEHKALREKKEFAAEKEKFEAEKAEFAAQKNGGHVNGGSVRVVQHGDTLTKIADSRDDDMKKARAQVRAALGGNADTKTVLGVLAIALAENSGKENVDKINVGDTISVSGDKINQVVAALKDAGKIEGGRLALDGKTNVAEILTPKNTPNMNDNIAGARQNKSNASV